jgi:DNA polymerase-1
VKREILVFYSTREKSWFLRKKKLAPNSFTRFTRNQEVYVSRASVRVKLLWLVKERKYTMKLAELLQKYLLQTTAPEGEETETNKKSKPRFAPLLVQPAMINAQALLDQEGITVHYIADPGQVVSELKKLIRSGRTLGLDIETAKRPSCEHHARAGLDPSLSRIRLVQVCAEKTVCIFDLEAVDLKLMDPLWNCSMVAHNAVFEMKHLMHAGVDLQNIHCTMLMANALHGNLPSLADLAQDYLGWKMSKEQQVSDWNAQSLSREQLAYAALDALVVCRLYEILHSEVREKKRFAVYALMRDSQKAIARLELNGCYFDTNGHGKLLNKWQVIKETADSELKQLIGPEINPGSSKQLSQWLMENLDNNTLLNWPRTEKGQLKTGANVLVSFSDHPLVKPLIKYKEAGKLLSTFGTKYAGHVNPKTGRIHANFRLGGTATGRLSCSSPNMQNLPRNKKFRALFCALPGRVLVVADYNQIELRIAALVSEDQTMLKAYLRGEDLHRKTAAEIAGIPFNKVTKEQRQAAKAINFGLLFGQGPKGLARYAKLKYGVAMTEREAKAARRSFFRTYYGLARWQKTTSRIAKMEKQVTTPGGRVRDFIKGKNGYRYTEALNTPIQGGAAEVLLAALSKLEGYLAETDAKLVNIIHDELVIEAAEEDLANVIDGVEWAMVEGMLAIFPDASTKNLVEINAGANWAEAK